MSFLSGGRSRTRDTTTGVVLDGDVTGEDDEDESVASFLVHGSDGKSMSSLVTSSDESSSSSVSVCDSDETSSTLSAAVSDDCSSHYSVLTWSPACSSGSDD